MKILLGNWTLKGYGGTECWTRDMAKEYLRRGHSVYLYTLEKGAMYDHIIAAGAMPFVEMKAYDIIIANHYPVVENLKYRSDYIIQTVHGVKNKFETPHPRADKLVAVSWEISRHHEIPIIIRNSLNLEQYWPVPYQGEKDSILCLCQGQLAAKMTETVARKLGMGYAWHSKNQNPVMDMPELISKHSIVVGAGRGIIEALAMGKKVVVADSRSYQTPLLNTNEFDAWNHNFSGRGMFAETLEMKALEKEITAPKGMIGDMIQEFHNIKVNAFNYLTIQ